VLFSTNEYSSFLRLLVVSLERTRPYFTYRITD
uniref:Uncharacterized protein n=1 Tax=Parascaris univalens TaxID=6257 RepID=A0A915BLJ8_PARUN